MAKKKGLMEWVNKFVALAITLAVGGLFLDGTSLANPLLGVVPGLVHTLIGWFVIAGGVIDFVMKLMK